MSEPTGEQLHEADVWDRLYEASRVEGEVRVHSDDLAGMLRWYQERGREVERLRTEAARHRTEREVWTKGMLQEQERLEARLREVVEAGEGLLAALKLWDRFERPADLADVIRAGEAALAAAQPKEENHG